MKSQRGEDRREKILLEAEAIILKKGFSATSIEDILERSHITKGGFFYHFPGKAELARALIERYIEKDDLLFTQLADRACSLTEDPLQQLLLFLNLLAETMENLEDVHPGCLVASFTYESQQIDDVVQELVNQSMLRWRAFFGHLIEKVVLQYGKPDEAELEEMADMLSAIIEGGIILSLVFKDKMTLVKLIRQYRNYIRVLFSPQTATTIARATA